MSLRRNPSRWTAADSKGCAFSSEYSILNKGECGLTIKNDRHQFFGSCLFFSFIKLVVDEIEGVQVRLACSGH
ncbi:MAG: hypothetical protein WAL79_03685 [Nitrososphaeraceae archaeon]